MKRLLRHVVQTDADLRSTNSDALTIEESLRALHLTNSPNNRPSNAFRSTYRPKKNPSKFTQSMNFLRTYSVGTLAILFLLVGASGIIIFDKYDSQRILALTKPVISAGQLTHVIAGPSLTIPNTELAAQEQKIENQLINVTVGGTTKQVSANDIKSWIKVTPSSNGVQDYLQIDTTAVDATIKGVANQFAVAPVNAVTVTHTDGITPSGIIVNGVNGTALGDLSGITAESLTSANTILNAGGAQFSAPLQTVPFQSYTPANFSKLIEVDLVTKRMYTYQNGQLLQAYLVSAGKPTTPTPVGEFHIYEKLAVQDMSGFNPDGTPYLQPHVQWINYFYGGDAIHGNYWRPLSYFGNINSSHGCVSLPNDLAVGIYNWAPIGTTVITHD